MSFFRLIFLGLVATAAFLLSACASSASLAKPAPAEDPLAVRQEIEVGQAAFAKISGKFGLSHDRDTTRYLNLYLKSLALYSQRQGLEFTLGILDSDQLNAYSLPGGYILITRGLLQRIEDPGTLTGILAHELGHINLRHILENVKLQTKKDFWETLARVIAGPRQIITASMDQINQQVEERLFIEGHAANDEFAADAYAVKLLQSLNISAEPYQRFLASLRKNPADKSLENLDKTHPPLQKRLDAMAGLIIADVPELSASPAFATFIQKIRSTEEPK